MKSRIVAVAPLLAVLLFSLVAATMSPATGEEAEVTPGQEAFVANKCNMCHSIDSVGIERTAKSEKMHASDLSTVGDEHDSAWIVQFAKQEIELDGEEHKKTYKGTDKDLDAIAAWLATLESDQG